MHYRRFVLLLATLLATVSAAQPPPRLTRAESFLGVHFDFHGGPNDRDVGRRTTPAMVNRLIDRVKPDYIQIDGKGHPGFSSYPTRVGTQVGVIVGDPLRIWRDVTAARGVSLFLHYSGVYDANAVKNPGWAAINADGTPHAKATSFWGPYAEKLLIPQLREIAGTYGVDGVWVDGECWSAVVDYGPDALAAFQKASGNKAVPMKPGDPNWLEFQEFHREAFRRYLRRYLASLKQTHPKFQVGSNWAFTDHMPEPVSAPVAFLSGDYAPDDSVNSARLSARFLAHQGLPWDLMAWSFSRKAAQVEGGKVQKSPEQLKREAAVVLALGGGFQAYFKQNRDGSIEEDEMLIMAEVAAFCRERQALAHRSKPVPQVAILLSKEDQYRRNPGLFSRNLNRVKGPLQALLESQYSVDVMGEHQLTGRLAQYPLIVVPECDALTRGFRDELARYAHGGGKLLLIGSNSAQLFARELNVTYTSNLLPAAALLLTHATVQGEFSARRQAVTPGPGVRTVGDLRVVGATNAAARGQPAATITRHGRGQIAAIHFTAGQAYFKDRPPVVRALITALTQELFPEPMVTVTGSSDVDVTLARNHGKLLVHLVNTSGPHATQPIQFTVAPLGPLEVALRLPARPARMTLEPGARPVSFEYRDGIARASVPRVEIHDILAVHE